STPPSPGRSSRSSRSELSWEATVSAAARTTRRTYRLLGCFGGYRTDLGAGDVHRPDAVPRSEPKLAVELIEKQRRCDQRCHLRQGCGARPDASVACSACCNA